MKRTLSWLVLLNIQMQNMWNWTVQTDLSVPFPKTVSKTSRNKGQEVSVVDCVLVERAKLGHRHTNWIESAWPKFYKVDDLWIPVYVCRTATWSGKLKLKSAIAASYWITLDSVCVPTAFEGELPTAQVILFLQKGNN